MSRDARSAPASQRRGVLISRPLDGGPEVHQDLVQCCHCQRVTVFVKGSGRRRGWCGRCNGMTCGAQRCDACVPFAQWLDNVEKGLPQDHRPVVG